MSTFAESLELILLYIAGFLPVLYNWLRTRRQTASVQLPSEPSNKRDLESMPLTGWRVLLLWIPAACDLTGTTVRNSSASASADSQVAIVDERWVTLHSRFNLPNDSWCSRSVRGDIQRHFPSSPTLAISVRHLFQRWK